MQDVAKQTRHLLRTYDGLLAGLTDDDLTRDPSPPSKTAGWLVGHLAITGDFARRLCGLAPMVPKEWRAVFAPGTSPSLDRSVYPPMQAMVDAVRAVYQDLAANAPNAAAEVVGQPNPFEAARGSFPTAGDFAQYIMSGHFGYHLGQLSIWRAAAGK